MLLRPVITCKVVLPERKKYFIIVVSITNERKTRILLKSKKLLLKQKELPLKQRETTYIMTNINSPLVRVYL